MNKSDNIKSFRFKRYTNSINIKKLERETQKLLFLGYVVAFSLYAALGSLVTYKKTEIRIVKPMEVRFIVRPPRMTMPFVIEERALQKKELKREVIKQLPPSNFQYRELISLQEMLKLLDSLEYDYNISPAIIAGILADIDSMYYREYAKQFEWERFDYREFVRDAPEYDEGITREPEKAISMKEFLFSIDDLDTGQYKGLVVIDPELKQNIKGFVYLPVDVWGSFFTPVVQTIGLMHGFKKYTGIDVKIDTHVFIDSPSIMKYPFIYISAGGRKPFDFSDRAKERLMKYISSGGFILFDPYSIPAYFSFREMINKICGDEGHIYPLTKEHPVFHTFFDFEEIPVMFPTLENEGLKDTSLPPDGVWLDDRLVAIIPPSPYRPFGSGWSGNEFENPSFRLAVNIIVYSLIRDGSIAEKYINVDVTNDERKRAFP
ncbi:DUF4159 domain-containing protein [Candidatus Latescibacterota bacterium]